MDARNSGGNSSETALVIKNHAGCSKEEEET